jgi:hypothetical protein
MGLVTTACHYVHESASCRFVHLRNWIICDESVLRLGHEGPPRNEDRRYQGYYAAVTIDDVETPGARNAPPTHRYTFFVPERLRDVADAALSRLSPEVIGQMDRFGPRGLDTAIRLRKALVALRDVVLDSSRPVEEVADLVLFTAYTDIPQG